MPVCHPTLSPSILLQSAHVLLSPGRAPGGSNERCTEKKVGTGRARELQVPIPLFWSVSFCLVLYTYPISLSDWQSARGGGGGEGVSDCECLSIAAHLETAQTYQRDI